MSLKEGLHIHNLTDFNISDIHNYDFVVLGGVFCSLTRIDNNINSYLDICEKIKTDYEKVKIYFQQPFYTKENIDLFTNTIIKAGKTALIDGVLVNSPGIVRYFNDDIEIVISRFAVGKRKRTNQYFYDFLADYNVIGMECFAADTELIADVKQYRNLPVWVREGRRQFPPKCFMKNNSAPCTNEQNECTACVYQRNKQNVKPAVAEQDISMSYFEGCDSIIHNVSGFEI